LLPSSIAMSRDLERGAKLVERNSYASEYDIIGLAALVVLHFTEATTLSFIHEYGPAIIAVIIGLYTLVVTAIAYIYRIYTHRPEAGKLVVSIALGGIFAGQLLLGIWKLVLMFGHV
jgi:hypothetical protein